MDTSDMLLSKLFGQAEPAEPVGKLKAALEALARVEASRNQRAALLAADEAALAVAKQAAVDAEVAATLAGEAAGKAAADLDGEAARLAAAIEKHRAVLAALDGLVAEAQANVAALLEDARAARAEAAAAIEDAEVAKLKVLAVKIRTIRAAIEAARNARGAYGKLDWRLPVNGTDMLLADDNLALPADVAKQLAGVSEIDGIVRKAERVASDYESSPAGRTAAAKAEADRAAAAQAAQEARRLAEVRANEERLEREWQERQEEAARKRAATPPGGALVLQRVGRH